MPTPRREDVHAKGSLHSGPQAKVDMFRGRFQLVMQRLQRNEDLTRKFQNEGVEVVWT